MCSRYGRWTPPEEFEEFSDIRLPTTPIPVTYNAAPRSIQPIIRLAKDGKPEVTLAQWGLIPFWAKDASIGVRTINARSEELADKPAFRESLKTRRCLIPVNCFYEWQHLSAKEKQPFAIGMEDERPFLLAGLWDRWKSPHGAVIESFTITTTSPNERLKALHDRMPCIIGRQDYLRWIEPGEVTRPPADLLRPYPAEAMRYWSVGKAVGNVRNDEAGLIEPLLEP